MRGSWNLLLAAARIVSSQPGPLAARAGKWKKVQIGRQLKLMGLQRGKLTDRQVGAASRRDLGLLL